MSDYTYIEEAVEAFLAGNGIAVEQHAETERWHIRYSDGTFGEVLWEHKVTALVYALEYVSGSRAT